MTRLLAVVMFAWLRGSRALVVNAPSALGKKSTAADVIAIRHAELLQHPPWTEFREARELSDDGRARRLQVRRAGGDRGLLSHGSLPRTWS